MNTITNINGYAIRIDQGEYLQERGGYDWGRSSLDGATIYRSEAEAMGSARRLKVETLVREVVDLDA